MKLYKPVELLSPAKDKETAIAAINSTFFSKTFSGVNDDSPSYLRTHRTSRSTLAAAQNR